MAKAKQVTVTEAAAEAVKKVPNRRDCSCGCGGQTRGGLWVPGHDAKAKGALLKSFDAGNAEAGATLVERGWRTEAQLNERRAKAEAKAAKAAKPAVEEEAA